jgi:hypothetical protein
MGEVPRYSGGDWQMIAQIPQHFILPQFAVEFLPHFAEDLLL